MKEKKKLFKYLPWLLSAIAVIAIVGLATFLNSFFDEEKVEKKKMVQQITVITPPPPPPPPPPEMKEPELEEEMVEEEMDEALPDDGPEEIVGEDLGIDADGGAGGDSFGLVGKKGGRGLLGGGGYSSTIKAEINKALLRDDKLKSLEYEAIVTLWVEENGNFLRFSIELINGDNFTETELSRFFNEFEGIGKAKPLEEKANRFRFKITSVI